MPTRLWVTAWLAWVVIVPSLAAAQERSEQELVDLVVSDGPQAHAIRAAVLVTAREQQARRVFPNPAVSYSREGAGFNEFFEIEQPLPLFGTRAALARAGLSAVEAAEAERDARLWQLRSDARAAVSRLIAGQQRVEAAEATDRAIEQLITVLRTREAEGEGSRFDRLRAQQELADSRQTVTAARIEAADARAVLAGLLPPGMTLTHVTGDLYRERPLQPIDTLFSRASQTRAELKALEHVAQRFAREEVVTRRMLLPTPTILGGLKRADNESGRDAGGVFGVSVSLPLFNTGDRDIAKWQAERARVDAERLALNAHINAEITRATTALTLRQELATALDPESSSGDELVGIATVAYREGEIGILELLDAYRTAARTTFRAIDVRLDARLAQIALERAVGEILWP